jgi:transcriptional regulator
MYVPEHFRETRLPVLQAFIDRHALAALVALTSEGLTANHIPLQGKLVSGGHGWLRGHIARANPLWHELSNGATVLAIFSGAEHYISPSWYPSKHEHGKAVPTWNYAAVHISGSIRFVEDASWLHDFVSSLTDIHEQEQVNRWHVSDAPADYIQVMLRAIIGFEVTISSIVGKFKGSQNRSAADRAAVTTALLAEGSTPEAIAELVPDSRTEAAAQVQPRPPVQ